MPVTLSSVALPASTAVAEYCDVAPTAGGAPVIDSDVTVDEGSVDGMLVHADIAKPTTSAKEVMKRRVRIVVGRLRAQSLPCAPRQTLAFPGVSRRLVLAVFTCADG